MIRCRRPRHKQGLDQLRTEGFSGAKIATRTTRTAALRRGRRSRGVAERICAHVDIIELARGASSLRSDVQRLFGDINVFEEYTIARTVARARG